MPDFRKMNLLELKTAYETAKEEYRETLKEFKRFQSIDGQIAFAIERTKIQLEDLKGDKKIEKIIFYDFDYLDDAMELDSFTPLSKYYQLQESENRIVGSPKFYIESFELSLQYLISQHKKVKEYIKTLWDLWNIYEENYIKLKAKFNEKVFVKEVATLINTYNGFSEKEKNKEIKKSREQSKYYELVESLPKELTLEERKQKAAEELKKSYVAIERGYHREKTKRTES